MSDLLRLGLPWWDLAFRAALVYLVLLLGFRLTGKREVGQFTLFDLVFVLLVSNAVQPAITGPDVSLAGGLVIVAALLAVNALVAQLRLRSPLVRRLMEGHPTVIAREGRWLPEALRREGLSEEDCLMAMREHGVQDVREVALAILETDGTISILTGGGPLRRGSRKVAGRQMTGRP
ncbi:MAG: DUF421 domain-containing protein [Clostridia bacterium]|nr:DUF421 domain-containing protein [Clostridia bacterium]MCL6522301.1 DUF421 domain-containing protein [Bacillota bacterium]